MRRSYRSSSWRSMPPKGQGKAACTDQIPRLYGVIKGTERILGMIEPSWSDGSALGGPRAPCAVDGAVHEFRPKMGRSDPIAPSTAQGARGPPKALPSDQLGSIIPSSRSVPLMTP